MSPRDRLVCFRVFVGMTLLALCFSGTTTQLFSKSLSSHSLCSCLEMFSKNSNICNFWRNKFQQVNTQQSERNFYTKRELQFSQQLVQLHGNRAHVVDQYFYRMKSLLVLKQPSCNVFFVRNECWRLL